MSLIIDGAVNGVGRLVRATAAGCGICKRVRSDIRGVDSVWGNYSWSRGS